MMTRKNCVDKGGMVGRLTRSVVLAFLVASLCGPVSALDPPHDFTRSIECSSCHVLHVAPGGALTLVEGNANLCMSCHLVGGMATALPFVDADQAVPGPNLPPTVTPSGTSHRWDSSAAGRVAPDGAITSTGTVASTGTFTGRFAKTYTITINAGGPVGVATFSWTATGPVGGTGTNLTTGASVPLNEGIALSFTDGPAPTSFVAGERWHVFVRPDLREPVTPAMAARTEDGHLMCSTCHDVHSQRRGPFDPGAPPFTGRGTGLGRNFQRVDNSANALCVDCHAARDVTQSAAGSHPVGVPLPPAGEYQAPTTALLDGAGNVGCMSCHTLHYAPTTDGTLSVLADQVALCTDCHTLADTTTPASHLDPTTGVLWPGGQYGSLAPAVTDTAKTGQCVNCHRPHGWPDDANPAADFPQLLVERNDVANDGSDPDDAEDLCSTCHDGAPAVNIRSEFAKGTNTPVQTFHHPVLDSEQAVGRSVECHDCHNPHRATAADPIRGATGIDLAGNPMGPGSGNPAPVAEYNVCLKCHGDTYLAGRDINGDGFADTTNKRLDFALDASAYHPVSQPGRNTSGAMQAQLLGGLTTGSTILCSDCHNNEQTANAQGRAASSAAAPQGPHGSTIFPLLRAVSDLRGLPTNTPAAGSFELCFLCHDQAKLVNARRFGDGARTNFYGGAKDSLHWFHLVDFGQVSCRSCHYSSHGNSAAPNTTYRIESNGTLIASGDTPPVAPKPCSTRSTAKSRKRYSTEKANRFLAARSAASPSRVR